MKDLMILIATVFLLSTSLSAQVKDQFRDKDNTSTIVVVKEDGAIDQKLLDDHFNLADMSMNDQIMIMTAPDPLEPATAPDMENATSSTGDDIEDFFNDFENEETEAETEVEIIANETNDSNNVAIASNKEVAPSTANRVNTSTRKASSRARSGNYAVKNSADVKRAAQKKYFGKKKKKKNNRKKLFGKKKSNSCYNF